MRVPLRFRAGVPGVMRDGNAFQARSPGGLRSPPACGLHLPAVSERPERIPGAHPHGTAEPASVRKACSPRARVPDRVPALPRHLGPRRAFYLGAFSPVGTTRERGRAAHPGGTARRECVSDGPRRLRARRSHVPGRPPYRYVDLICPHPVSITGVAHGNGSHVVSSPRYSPPARPHRTSEMT